MSNDALIFDSRHRERAEKLWRQIKAELSHSAHRSPDGAWCAPVLGRRGITPVGPIAQRWLDNDAPLVTGLPAREGGFG